MLRKGQPGVIGPQAVEAMTARHRAAVVDQTFRHVIDMGLGLIVNSAHYSDEIPPYGYGPQAGYRAFGHSGQLSSCAFCDPDQGLVVAWVCNGMPEEAASHERQHFESLVRQAHLLGSQSVDLAANAFELRCEFQAIASLMKTHDVGTSLAGVLLIELRDQWFDRVGISQVEHFGQLARCQRCAADKEQCFED